jgi:hypothetical protein
MQIPLLTPWCKWSFLSPTFLLVAIERLSGCLDLSFVVWFPKVIGLSQFCVSICWNVVETFHVSTPNAFELIKNKIRWIDSRSDIFVDSIMSDRPLCRIIGTLGWYSLSAFLSFKRVFSHRARSAYSLFGGWEDRKPARSRHTSWSILGGNGLAIDFRLDCLDYFYLRRCERAPTQIGLIIIMWLHAFWVRQHIRKMLCPLLAGLICLLLVCRWTGCKYG